MGGFSSDRRYTPGLADRTLIEPIDNTTSPTAAECERRANIIQQVESGWNEIVYQELTGECQTLYQEAAINYNNLLNRQCSGESNAFDSLVQTWANQIRDLQDASCQATDRDGGDRTRGPDATECARREEIILEYEQRLAAVDYSMLTSSCQDLYGTTSDLIGGIKSYQCAGAMSTFEDLRSPISRNLADLESSACERSETIEETGPSAAECDRRATVIDNYEARLGAIDYGNLIADCQATYTKTRNALDGLKDYACFGTSSEFEQIRARVEYQLATVENISCKQSTDDGGGDDGGGGGGDDGGGGGGDDGGGGGGDDGSGGGGGGDDGSGSGGGGDDPGVMIPDSSGEVQEAGFGNTALYVAGGGAALYLLWKTFG